MSGPNNIRQLALNNSKFKQFDYCSIPNCCDIASIRSIGVKAPITKKGQTGMIFFKKKDAPLVKKLSHQVKIALESYFTSQGKPKEPPQGVKFYWIHTPTACRVMEIKASEFAAYQTYDYNYFDTKQEAEKVINQIIKPIFLSYGIRIP